MSKRNLTNFEEDLIMDIHESIGAAFRDRIKEAKQKAAEADQRQRVAEKARKDNPRYQELSRVTRMPGHEMEKVFEALGKGNASLGCDQRNDEMHDLSAECRKAANAAFAAHSLVGDLKLDEARESSIEFLLAGQRLGFIMGVRHVSQILSDPQATVASVLKIVDILHNPEKVDALVGKLSPAMFPNPPVRSWGCLNPSEDEEAAVQSPVDEATPNEGQEGTAKHRQQEPDEKMDPKLLDVIDELDKAGQVLDEALVDAGANTPGILKALKDLEAAYTLQIEYFACQDPHQLRCQKDRCPKVCVPDSEVDPGEDPDVMEFYKVHPRLVAVDKAFERANKAANKALEAAGANTPEIKKALHDLELVNDRYLMYYLHLWASLAQATRSAEKAAAATMAPSENGVKPREKFSVGFYPVELDDRLDEASDALEKALEGAGASSEIRAAVRKLEGVYDDIAAACAQRHRVFRSIRRKAQQA